MKIAFPTDEHYPWQDERAREVALRIVQDFDPDVLICGSDGLDFYQISTFDKNPARIKLGLQNEIDQWKKGHREWRSAAPRAKRIFLIGNHEDRLRKYLWRHQEISDLEALKLSSLLGFAELGIDGEPQKEFVDGNLVIRHGRYVRRHSGMSTRAEIEHDHYSTSLLTGHTHRGGTYLARTRNGIVQGHECFCLCSLEAEYIDHPDWQQGIVLAETNKNIVSVEPVLINEFRHRKRAIWRGNEYLSK